jgi:hypothetical protein
MPVMMSSHLKVRRWVTTVVEVAGFNSSGVESPQFSMIARPVALVPLEIAK